VNTKQLNDQHKVLPWSLLLSVTVAPLRSGGRVGCPRLLTPDKFLGRCCQCHRHPVLRLILLSHWQFIGAISFFPNVLVFAFYALKGHD
jgi:hypothetical protein